MITIDNYNVDLADSKDQKLMLQIAKEMKFDRKVLGTRSDRDETPTGLQETPAIMEGSLRQIYFLTNSPKLKRIQKQLVVI